MLVADATTALIEAVVLFSPAHKQKALRLIVDSVNVGMERALLLSGEGREGDSGEDGSDDRRRISKAGATRTLPE
jgi:hypothetical protein